MSYPDQHDQGRDHPIVDSTVTTLEITDSYTCEHKIYVQKLLVMSTECDPCKQSYAFDNVIGVMSVILEQLTSRS